MTWRTRWLARLVAWLVIIAYPAAFVAVTATQLASSDGEPMAAAVTWLMFLPLPIGAWLWGLRPWIRLDDSHVTVRNPLSTREIPYDSILECSPGFTGVVITTSTGESINAMAVQKSNWAQWFHRRTRGDEVAEAILARRPR